MTFLQTLLLGLFGSTSFATLIIELLRRHDQKKEKKENVATKQEVEDLRQDIKLLKKSNLVDKKQRLMELMKFYLNRGYIEVDELETLTELVEAYEALGGDGFIHDLFELVKELPIR